jgi:hypothetical protein
MAGRFWLLQCFFSDFDGFNDLIFNGLFRRAPRKGKKSD